MTPEERWIQIENAIKAQLETQARHDAQIEKQTAQIEKQNAGIRDLIVVSRTLIEAQQATDKKLSTLADTVNQLGITVDRFLKGLQKPNGNR